MNEECSEGADLEVRDSYAEPNGTTWLLCAVPLDESEIVSAALAGPAALVEQTLHSDKVEEDRSPAEEDRTLSAGPLVPEPLAIDSYLNSLTLTHIYTARRRTAFPLNASLHLNPGDNSRIFTIICN